MITPQPGLWGLASSLETNVSLTWKTTRRIWHRKGNNSQRQKGRVLPGRINGQMMFLHLNLHQRTSVKNTGRITHSHIFFFFCIKMSLWHIFTNHCRCEGKIHTYRYLSILLFHHSEKSYIFPLAFHEDVENSSPGKTILSIPPSLLASQRSDFHS